MELIRVRHLLERGNSGWVILPGQACGNVDAKKFGISTFYDILHGNQVPQEFAGDLKALLIEIAQSVEFIPEQSKISEGFAILIGNYSAQYAHRPAFEALNEVVSHVE